jgi:hypothetical protein
MLFKQTGEKQDIIKGLVGWANLAQTIGQTERTMKICAALEVLLQTNNGNLVSPEREIYERVVTTLRSQLNDDVFAKVWAEGRAMTLEES